MTVLVEANDLRKTCSHTPAVAGLDLSVAAGEAYGLRGPAPAGGWRNAGQDGSVVVDKVRQGKGSFGYNAAPEEYEDLMKAGIIDPTKVGRTALQNSASVAGMLLTTEAMVAEKPKEEKPAAGMAHGGEDF